MGVWVGLAGGVLAFIALVFALRNLLKGDVLKTGLFFVANFLVIGAVLLIVALNKPEELGWAGAAMAGVMIVGGIGNIIMQQLKKEKAKPDRLDSNEQIQKEELQRKEEDQK